MVSEDCTQPNDNAACRCSLWQWVRRIFTEQFAEFLEFLNLRHVSASSSPDPIIVEKETPEELLEAAYQKVRTDLGVEILQTIKSCSPAFFERLVVDVLVKMWYGGTRQDAG
jgi:restriction system protein